MPHRDSLLPARTRRVLHLDVDAFLASVEQARDPRLVGRPVIVGGAPDSRNLVMSCSYEARDRGVRPGMMSRQAARLCPQAIFLPGDSGAAGVKREEIVRVCRSSGQARRRRHECERKHDRNRRSSPDHRADRIRTESA